MPRANRHFLPGHVWHITFNAAGHVWHITFNAAARSNRSSCSIAALRSNRLKWESFARDRRRYLRWMFEAKKRFGVSVLNYYVVTSNDVHLLVKDTGW